MRIAVVSDTHMPRFGRRLPAALVRGLTEPRVDLILHAGDFTAAFVPDLFEAIGPLVAVAGNNDPPELVERFGRRRTVEVDGVRIGLVHGDEGRGARTIDRALDAFDGAPAAARTLDAIVFGHSHIPVLERRGALLLLNPGSPTDRRRQPAYSYALLELAGGALEARLVTYDDRSAE